MHPVHKRLQGGLLLSLMSFQAMADMPDYPPSSKQRLNTDQSVRIAKQSNASSAQKEMRQHSKLLRLLMLELYKSNPLELQKSTKVSAEEMTQWVFEGPFNWKFDAIRNLQQTDALALSFNKAYQGDRVLAFIVGLHTLLLQAYGGQNEFIFSDRINPQNLYFAARNVEIASVKAQDLIREQVWNYPLHLNEILLKISHKTNMNAITLAAKNHDIIQQDSNAPASADFFNINP